MTEASQVNEAVRKHLGHLGRWLRMEHKFSLGVPDWYYRMRGAQGWLECKLVKGNSCGISLDQLRWGEDEVRWGGRWFVLAYRPRDRGWGWFNVAGARRWFEGMSPEEASTSWTTGPFPWQIGLELLAPPPRLVGQ